MKVIVCFELPEIKDVNGETADATVEALTAQTVEWQEEWAARLSQPVSVWVDDVTN